MKVWITKHALTKGIYQIDAVKFDGTVRPRDKIWFKPFIKGEWFEDKQDAIMDAEKRRAKRLKSLYDQVNKISALKFE